MPNGGDQLNNRSNLISRQSVFINNDEGLSKQE